MLPNLKFWKCLSWTHQSSDKWRSPFFDSGEKWRPQIFFIWKWLDFRKSFGTRNAFSSAAKNVKSLKNSDNNEPHWSPNQTCPSWNILQMNCIFSHLLPITAHLLHPKLPSSTPPRAVLTFKGLTWPRAPWCHALGPEIPSLVLTLHCDRAGLAQYSKSSYARLTVTGAALANTEIYAWQLLGPRSNTAESNGLVVEQGRWVIGWLPNVHLTSPRLLSSFQSIHRSICVHSVYAVATLHWGEYFDRFHQSLEANGCGKKYFKTVPCTFSRRLLS